MKNFKKLFTFMLAISIVFTACNKDTSLTEVKNIDPTEQKILNFKEKMKIGDKSGETMTVEDAVWNIEAALNYTYCNSEISEVIGVDSVFVTVDVTENGELNFNDVINAYDQLNLGLINVIGNNTMRLADVEFIETSNKSGEKQLKLVVVETKRPTAFLTTFGPTDYWKPMWEDGKCDTYEGQGVGNDAKTMIQKKINLLRFYGYFTDVQTILIHEGLSQEYFWQGYDTDCLNPTEMNYWLSKGKECAEFNKPAGKNLISAQYYWDGITGGKSTWYLHFAEFNYGILHSITPIYY